MAEHNIEEECVDDECPVYGVEYGYPYKDHFSMLNTRTYIDKYGSDPLRWVENGFSPVDFIEKFNTLEAEIKEERKSLLKEKKRLEKEIYYHKFVIQLGDAYELLKDCVSRT
jgi:hypothetical protein